MNPSQAQKTNPGYGLHKSTEVRADSLDHNLPKTLPVSIKTINGNQTAVTVNFETNGTVYTMPNVNMPMWINRYIRYPYAVGDKGYAVSGSISITPSDNLGPSPAAFTQLPNLSTMVFHPVADTQNFPAMTDPNATEHTAPNGHLLHDDQKISLVKIHPTEGVSVSSGGNSASTPGPQNFQASPSGATQINATGPHTETAESITNTSATTHTITAPGGHNIHAPTNVSDLLSALGGLAIPSGQPISVPSQSLPSSALQNQSVTNTQLAEGAASANVGALSGDLSGSLPNPNVVGLTHIANANSLPIYANNAAALAGGLVAGQLYINNTISGTEQVLCVCFTP